MTNSDRTVIESLGAYLPAREVTTQDVVKGCAKPMLLPLERLTGIQSRRVAGEMEFSYDLAFKAVADCFAVSERAPDDIDLIVCCNISRYDGPDTYSFEPSTAVKLRDAFGLRRALAFDITNACAGMFTGIYLVDALVRCGAIRRGLVASGECITHLADTAQKEISGLADSRVACLTLGDAGAAVIVEAASNSEHGFHGLELFTLGRHSELCIAKVTDQRHGGAIMKTDMIKLAELSITAFMRHAALMAIRLGWSPAMIDHVLPHQTSRVSLGSGSHKVQRAVAGRFAYEDKVIDNVTHRGNTATTSHFVALKDCFINGKVTSGQSVVFAILASGITVGTAMYRFDDLPDRVRSTHKNGDAPAPAPLPPPTDELFVRRDQRPRVRIASVGVLDPIGAGTPDTMRMLTTACERCLARSAYDRTDVNVLISAGVYRTDFLMEPALAALLAGAIRANDAAQPQDGKKTLAFDVANGGLGFLNACHLAAELIRSKSAKLVMVAASEVENNASIASESPRGLRETASAVLLGASENGETGFGAMCFRSFPEHAKSLRVNARLRQVRKNDHCVARLYVKQDPALDERFVDCIVATVKTLVETEGLTPENIGAVLPPQISPAFIDRLSAALGWPRAKFIDVSGDGDLFTSSLPYAFARLSETGQPAPGAVALVINVGAGIQVGCALYHF